MEPKAFDIRVVGLSFNMPLFHSFSSRFNVSGSSNSSQIHFKNNPKSIFKEEINFKVVD